MYHGLAMLIKKLVPNGWGKKAEKNWLESIALKKLIGSESMIRRVRPPELYLQKRAICQYDLIPLISYTLLFSFHSLDFLSFSYFHSSFTPLQFHRTQPVTTLIYFIRRLATPKWKRPCKNVANEKLLLLWIYWLNGICNIFVSALPPFSSCAYFYISTLLFFPLTNAIFLLSMSSVNNRTRPFQISGHFFSH